MSAYRDRPLDCPRCGLELIRSEARDCWGCKRCGGMLLGVGELIDELLVIAPDLLPKAGVRSITTLGRRTAAPLLTCAACGAPMEPVFLGAVEVDRCYHDDQLWFDAGEHQLVVERAGEQHAERAPGSWLDRLRAKLAR